MDSFLCPFCNQSFRRRDVLVRHWKTCKGRLKQGEPIPELPKRRRGARKRACNACTRLKKACSMEMPCELCVSRKQVCKFSLMTEFEDVDDVVTSPTVKRQLSELNRRRLLSLTSTEVAEVAPDLVPQYQSEKLRVASHIHPPISHFQEIFWQQELDFFSHMITGESISACFVIGDDQKRQIIMSRYPVRSAVQTSAIGPIQAAYPDPVYSQLSDTGITWSGQWSNSGAVLGFWPFSDDSLLGTWPLPQESPIDPNQIEWADQLKNPLAIKMEEIVRGIKSTVTKTKSDSMQDMVWTPELEQKCRQFFSPTNLRKFLFAYWSIWVPNLTISHEGTFNESSASATMTAAMALVGACMVPEMDVRENAYSFFDVVQEWIFNDVEFSNSPLEKCSDPNQVERRLDALRAAYLATVYQTWEGSPKKKDEMTGSPYTKLIEVCRSMDSLDTRHGDLEAYIAAGPTFENWQAFMFKECIIRTITYTWLLDSACAALFNKPPRMFLHERTLQIELVCPDELFIADSPSSWFALLTKWAHTDSGQQRLLIQEATTEMCAVTINPTLETWFSQMTTLQFFIIVHSFHSLIFHAHFGLYNEGAVAQLERGLLTWRSAWLARSRPMTDTHTLGFYRYAPEYWLLAFLMLKKPDLRRASGLNQSVRVFLDDYNVSEMAHMMKALALDQSQSGSA